ncbi:MAG: hypothetical protein GX885_00695 [Methanomicrobiales archaeon]|nr:hypothetical protein [Methanomicrobiales archaeon]
MVLALIIFTAVLFAPSPAPPDALDPADPAPPQPTGTPGPLTLLAGTRDRFPDVHLPGAAPVPTPEEGEPIDPGEDMVENITPPEPDYDDDELAGLVENSSVSLMLLSLQSTHALYSWDERAARESTASLHAFARGTLREAEGLFVSDPQKTAKAAFTRSLESYISVGDGLQGSDPLNSTRVDAALDGLQQGSVFLRRALEGLDRPVQHLPQEVAAVSFSAAHRDGTGEELALLQRYLYEDRNRANDISLMLAAATKTRTYCQYDKNAEVITADSGRMFLLVEVRATNLGHKGDSRTYKIQTPGISAFTLHYRGNTYSPVKLAPRTSLGEPYEAATLDRYERKVGYILFDVPEALALDESCLQVNLGGEEAPVWALGKTIA